MGRFVAGIVWLCLGLILIVILLSEGNENLWPAIVMFGLPGGLLLYFSTLGNAILCDVRQLSTLRSSC